MEKQLLRETTHEMHVTMSGQGMEDTIGKIFQMMRKQIFSEIPHPILHMDTKEVYFEKVDCVEKKEAFLFIFMPRVKKYYTITARIVLNVKYLDVEKEDK